MFKTQIQMLEDFLFILMLFLMSLGIQGKTSSSCYTCINASIYPLLFVLSLIFQLIQQK
jgi:hypothetical protein